MPRYPIDIHTHRLPSVPGEAIVCCQPDAFCPQEDGWYAVGIHPWRLEVYDWTDAAFKAHFEGLVRHPRVLAVGEAGLDKLVAVPLDIQTDALRYQARVAEAAGKPLQAAPRPPAVQHRPLRSRCSGRIHTAEGSR